MPRFTDLARAQFPLSCLSLHPTRANLTFRILNNICNKQKEIILINLKSGIKQNADMMNMSNEEQELLRKKQEIIREKMQLMKVGLKLSVIEIHFFFGPGRVNHIAPFDFAGARNRK